MNVNPGGKQRKMRDGWWDEKVQKMNYSLGIPKGMLGKWGAGGI